MSFEDVNTVLKAKLPKHDDVEPPMLKLVLLAIAQHTNANRGDHMAFAGMKRLSVMTGASVSSVSRAVNALDELGMFKKYVKGGGRKKSTYILDIAKLSNLGIDWNKEGFREGTQGSDTEPSHSVTEPSHSTTEPSGSVTEPNKVLNLGFDPSLYQGGVTSPDSLRSSVPPSAVSSHPDETKHQNPNPKTSGALGVQAKTTPKPNPGQRLAQPYRPEPGFTDPYRACKKCGDTLKRDVNHICKGKAAPLDLGTVDDLTGDYITSKDGMRLRNL